MSRQFLANIGDPWPFKKMEVGDIAVCLDLRAASRAHTYGYATNKRFMTRTATNKITGQRAVKVVRISDDSYKRAPTNKFARGPERKHWPFDDLAKGEEWRCADPMMIPKALGAINRANRRHKMDHDCAKYSTRVKVGANHTYGELMVVRIV